MRPMLAAWLLGLIAMAGGVWITYVSCPGCIDRSRINSACEWTGDTAFPIDARNVAHQKHLVSDAHIAEELAIRHADVEFGRRFGVEHHGSGLWSTWLRTAIHMALFCGDKIPMTQS